MNTNLQINTSNKGKIEEYKSFFSKYGISLSSTSLDVKEIVHQDKYMVMRYKLLELPENIIIDDTSLDIVGHDVGTNVKWVIDDLLNTDKYLGCDCIFTTLLGVRRNSNCYIYTGKIDGKITKPLGQGFGFDPCILPNGKQLTLGESKTYDVNPRYEAVYNYVYNYNVRTYGEVEKWEGEYQ